MVKMSIEQIKTKLVNFVNDYNDNGRYVTTDMLRSYVKQQNNITKKDMGYAIQLLRRQNRLFYTRKLGWVAKW